MTGSEVTWAVKAMQAVRQLELGSDTDREVAGALRRSGLGGFSGCEATKALR